MPRIHPLVSVEKNLWSNALGMLRDFGMTPLSMRRLGIKIEAPKKPSVWDKYLSYDAG